MNAWIPILPGVYQPVRILPAPACPATRSTRTRPAWFPRHIVRKPVRRYRVHDAYQLPY
jgi:hypothetical protein